MQKLLLISGVVLLILGLLWPWISQLGLGRLPGDLALERGPVTFYFPIVTCIILSVGLTILFRLFGGR
jgi:hypothetical protein